MKVIVKQITEHSFMYRGFTIIKLPRKAVTPITRYHVWLLDDQSFGKFDSMAEAVKYIDGLKNETYSNDNV
ncbi:hypothetical protein KEP48_05795 [Proteus mirabilis]|uniref:hypothetical protein n=1 Tax=Proteus mirabilis TaxID=584 RepID=UPI001261C2DF|nr:hypothetical protein [Proteus mirabilis]KAB7730615.1 hypothetical protein GBN10_00425 [Proteus mirabilis]MBS3855261.1 hypothetical protein [Proteus mirabilis]MCW4525884.1 hypothetical protein [Proteus mirabilis]